MKKRHPEFDYNCCVACGICVQGCPLSALELSKNGLDKWNKAYPQRNERKCIACGICAKNCPMGVITMIEDSSDMNQNTLTMP